MNGPTSRSGALAVRLKLLSQDDVTRIALLSIATGLFFVLYHLLSGAIEKTDSHSTFNWLRLRWTTATGIHGALYATIGWFIPVVSMLLIWLRRRQIMAAPRAVNWGGLGVVVVALLLHYIGSKGEHHRLSVLSMVVLLWGSILFLNGWQVARLLIFPVGFMGFMIPVNFLAAGMFPVRIALARISTVLLAGLGVDCTSRGTVILGKGEAPFMLALQPNTVAFRDLLLFVVLMSLFAYLSQKSLARRVLVFLCAVPAYALSNVMVTVALGMLAQLFGDRTREVLGDNHISILILLISSSLMAGIAWTTRTWDSRAFTRQAVRT